MTDWRVIQRQRADRLAAKGFACLASEIGLDEMVTRVRRKEFPPTAVWFWCLQECWGPQ